MLLRLRLHARSLSTQVRKPVPGEVPGGPKPIVYRKMVLNSKVVVFYTFLFTIPPLLMFMYTGGKTQLSEAELLSSEAARRKKQENFGDEDTERIRERREMVNKVLFQNKGSLGKPEWALKRDEERRRQQEIKAQEGK